MSKFSSWLNGLTADASPDTAADYLVSYDASATTSKKVLLSVLLALASGSGIPADGWVAAADTWTYASADGPTFTFTIAGVDRTNVLQAGMRVKLTQTTAKYFIITKTAFSTNTTITIYGGTDYTLANAAISNPYYSPVKAPFGFNTDPAKWTETATDTTDATQASPTSGTWYNLGTVSLSVPIGCWHLSYKAHLEINKGNATDQQMFATLSTANNSESDANMTTLAFSVQAANTVARAECSVYAFKHVTLTSKTTHYLNGKAAETGVTDINFRGDLAKTIIRAVSAYL